MSQQYTVRELCEKFNYSRVYVMKSIREKKLEAALQQIGNTKVERYIITAEAVSTWEAAKKFSSRSKDGKRSYKLRLSEAEAEALNTWLAESEIEADLKLAFQKK